MLAISVTSARREQKEEQERRSRMPGEGGTETQVLNLVWCDIPEKNNTASPYSCSGWRKTYGGREGVEVGNIQRTQWSWTFRGPWTHAKNKGSAWDTRCQIEFNKFFCGSEETMLRYKKSFHCYPGLLDVEVLRAGALGYHVILCLSSYPWPSAEGGSIRERRRKWWDGGKAKE